MSQVLTALVSQESTLKVMVCMGLIFFVTFFVGLIVWTGRKSQRPVYQSMSEMPLDDEVRKGN
jgi:cbb3-type cytochrome oxidase subunit 3